MAEVITNPAGIYYDEREHRRMEGAFSRLRPVEPGDLCCHCGLACDDAGFSTDNRKAYRIRGHPLCARFTCYNARWDEFNGRRDGCRCGRRKQNKGEV